MIDFNTLKNTNNFAQLQKKLEQSNQGGGYKKDDRFWRPTPNKDAKFNGIVRLLPIPFVDYEAVSKNELVSEDLTPVAKIISYSFQADTGKWYIENSLATFGEADPVANWSISEFKKAKDADDKKRKEYLKKYLPKEDLICGVYVERDDTEPSNNGTIRLWKVPKTLWKMVEKAQKPEFEDETAFDPFDLFNGKPLKLRITYEKKTFGGRENLSPIFSACVWGDMGPIFENDKEIEDMWKKQHSIADFYNRKHFKSFDKLEEKFNFTMGFTGEQGGNAAKGSQLGKETSEFISVNQSAPEPQGKTIDSSDGIDDALLEFEKLMAGE